MKNKHSNQDEPDMISIFIGTWNMGQIHMHTLLRFFKAWSLWAIELQTSPLLQNAPSVQQFYNTKEQCRELFIRENKQPLHKLMAQHRWATSSLQDSAVHLHFRETGHLFEDNQAHVLARENRWFERSVKEAIHVKLEKTFLNRGGWLTYFVSRTSNAVLPSAIQTFTHFYMIWWLIIMWPWKYWRNTHKGNLANDPANEPQVTIQIISMLMAR